MKRWQWWTLTGLGLASAALMTFLAVLARMKGLTWEEFLEWLMFRIGEVIGMVLSGGVLLLLVSLTTIVLLSPLWGPVAIWVWWRRRRKAAATTPKA